MIDYFSPLKRYMTKIFLFSVLAPLIFFITNPSTGYSLSTHAPVQGQVQDSGEQIAGEVVEFCDGGNKFTMKTSKGTVCKGYFIYARKFPKNGKRSPQKYSCDYFWEDRWRGSSFCDDDRKISFEFIASPGVLNGTGYGELGGQPFRFMIGKMPERSNTTSYLRHKLRRLLLLTGYARFCLDLGENETR